MTARGNTDEQANRATGNGGFDLVDENLSGGEPAVARLSGEGSEGDEDASGGGAARQLSTAVTPACVNTWQANSFVTDNEGDGPGAGCIR